MNMKKKLVTVCLVACMAVTAVAGGTLAYFTDKTEDKTNTFTVGNVTITLTEPEWTAAGYDNNNPVLKPKAEIAKDPTVTVNGGSENAWVFVEVAIGDKFNSLMDTYAGTKGQADNVQLEAWTDGLNEGWHYMGDQNGKLIYAYETALQETEKATLFDKIMVPEGLTSEEVEEAKGDNTTLTITGAAIQADGIGTYTDAYNTLYNVK